MQLLDELPMIWTASILLYASLSRSVAHPTRFSIGLTAATTGITVFYLYVAKPEILFVSFGVLLIAVLIVNLLKETSKKPDKRIVSQMKWVGIPMLAIGFGCWLIDRHFCKTLQTWRAAVDQPYAALLELHGWW